MYYTASFSKLYRTYTSRILKMCFSRDQLLVFGLGVAATAALSYKFTRDLFGRQTVSSKQALIGRKGESGCPMQPNGGLVTNGIMKPTMVDFIGQTNQKWISDGVDINNNNNYTAVTDDVTSVGCQFGTDPSELVDSETQTDVIGDSAATSEEELVVALNLKMIHANVFMLKKHFDEDLSKQVVGDLDVAFYRSKQLGNYIFIQADSKTDLEEGAAFCAEKYQGEKVTRSMLPWRLFCEKSVSLLKVIGKKATNQD